MNEAKPEHDPDLLTENMAQKRPSRRIVRSIGLLFIILAVAVGWFLLVAYFGWRSGEDLLAEKQAIALAEQITHQKELAADDVAQEKYDLALRRLEWVLQQAPEDAQALALQTEVNNAVTSLLVSTPFSIKTPTPEPTPLPETTVESTGEAETKLQQIRRLMATKDYGVVIPMITAFQLEFPEYERQETNRFLYDASINYGIDLLESDNVELGLNYLAQAARLGDLPQSAIDYQTWAELYLQGISFYGVNWDTSAYYFRDLCLAAPFYQLSCNRLEKVLILLGDQQAVALDWCPAQNAYEEAALYSNNSDLNDKIDEARDACLLATPTPELPTEAITDTTTITTTLPSALPDLLTPEPTPVP